MMLQSFMKSPTLCLKVTPPPRQHRNLFKMAPSLGRSTVLRKNSGNKCPFPYSYAFFSVHNYEANIKTIKNNDDSSELRERNIYNKRC